MGDPRVVIIGAGQAGLAVSHEHHAAGVDHAVVERDRVGQTWRSRWDSFCLVTPNWTMNLLISSLRTIESASARP